MASVIIELANTGIQVFMATRSLFLLREIELLSQQKKYKQLNNAIFSEQS
jgi:transketolase C-terminal domain/subunit